MTDDTSLRLSLRIAAISAPSPSIRVLTLQGEDGAVLPGFEAGAHVPVQVTLPDGRADWRHYSLVNFKPAPGANVAPRSYTIGVRRDDMGRGGSVYMHTRLSVGDRLVTQVPRNAFALQSGTGRAVLVAGGIGITPLASMAAQCRAEGRPIRMLYAGRSRSQMAFVPELQALLGADLRLHADDAAGAPLDLETVLDGCGGDTLYVCGPQPLIDGVLERAARRGWPPGRVVFERFSVAPAAGDRAFELVLARSGKRFVVPAQQTVLDALIEHGCDPLYDCRAGICGTCVVGVVEGDIDHRDQCLGKAERASGRVMQVCVSRARGDRLVLDI